MLIRLVAILFVVAANSSSLAQEFKAHSRSVLNSNGVSISFGDVATLRAENLKTVSQVSHSAANQDGISPQLKEPSQPLRGSQLILSSDEPVDSPVFDLNEDQPNPSDSSQPGETAKTTPSNSGYRLPPVANVQSPIAMMPLTGIGQNDPSGLLVGGQTANSSVQFVDRSTKFSDFSTNPASTKIATWRAHNFYHRPLYFEDRNLERYGNKRGLANSENGAIQNVASAVHFLGHTRRLPYHVGQRSPRSRVYTHGLPRPGDNVPFQSQIPARISPKGAALQTVVSLGIILP